MKRRGPEAATPPQALQPGIICCPPTPGEPAESRRQAGEGDTRQRKPPPMAQGQMDTRHTEKTGATAPNKTKQNKNRQKMKISWCSVWDLAARWREWKRTGKRRGQG